MSAAAAAADATPVKPGGKKKLVIMIAVAAIVLGGGGVGALLYMKKQKAAAEAAAAAAAEEGDADGAAPVKHEAKKAHGEKPVFVPMDPFVVNLADHEADRYAQIGITLEVPDEHVGEEIKTYLPAIRNNILLLLSRKTSQDLAGAEGKERLAKQVLRVAVAPMGVELEDEDAPPAEDAHDAPVKKGKDKGKHFDSIEDSPIKSVQFSSFIIQ